MGRLSEAIEYINSTEITQDDIKHKYTHITIPVDTELQKLRLKYQKNRREERRLLLLELESL